MCTAFQRIDFAIFSPLLRGEHNSALGIICHLEMLDLKKIGHGHPIHSKSSRFSSAKTAFTRCRHILKNGEKCDGCKIWASVHTIPEQFENGRNLDGKNSLQHFDAKKAYLRPKSRSVSFLKCLKCLKMFHSRHFQVFTRCCFQNLSVRVLFSKSTVFKICRQKMCRFRVNGRPIRQIFHRF